jgi:predicted nucleic acid-binding protein
MNVLLDTNTLLRMAEPRHPMSNAAVEAAASLLGSGENLCLVPQNLYEFWVVATRPVAQNGLGLSASQAEPELTKLKNRFTIYDDMPAIRPTWEQLVVKYQVVGKNAHDARLVAAMIVHRIPRILTFNIADFQRYKEIEAIAPESAARSS